MAFVPPARHLLRAKDLADARYFDPIGVDDMAASAGLSRAHFSREFKTAFGETPRGYLLTRRLERAAALLRTTDRSVSDICLSVGLVSQGSFTTRWPASAGSPSALPARRTRGAQGARRGVPETPEERPYGIDSGFRDPSGNSFRLTQVYELANT